jgi:Protein of unknown function with HXXEE motif
MATALIIWLVVLAFFLTHQLEEVVYSIGAWGADHLRPSRRRWTTYLSRSPMASPLLWVRLSTVAGQMLGLIVLGAAVNASLLATQVAATVVTAVMMLAFGMHITVSVLTRSSMPGLATSILPGLPGAVLVLTYVWTR